MAPATALANGTTESNDLLPSDEDLLYEEELLRNPFALKMWWRYLEARKDARPRRRYVLYERALKALPGSYKLWHAYLKERKEEVRGLSLQHLAVERLSHTYERALVSMHKMPCIWLEYLEHLLEQFLLTTTRRVFDRALCSLPITQHDRIWQLYLKFLMQPGIPTETAMRVYRRYLKFEPTHTEEYIVYLKAKEQWGEAAKKLAEVVNDDMFRSLEGKSKHQLWLELCDIITKHPNQVAHLKVDAILRSGIRNFTDEVGRLWTSLADYYIRQVMHEKARDVYEEGLTTVVTVRDFSLIFDTLTHFEESLITHKLRQMGEEEEEEAPEGDAEQFLLADDERDLDLRLARLEHLMERRPELLSSVMLRQNPHNVHEWHKRVKLFDEQPRKQIQAFTEAVRTVDPNKALGKLHTLWTAFARFYERHGDLENARVIMDKATQVGFKYVDDLASVWCEWAEMELRHKNYKRALSLMRRATETPPTHGRRHGAQEEREGPVQGRLYRSLKLWSFHCDLEESLGTLESTKAVYERILDMRIATPQLILNYAFFLQENKFFEDSFRVYERGVALFKWPHVKDIWAAYLTQFVQRYKGAKLERARDLFRQALGQAPPADSKDLFLQYAALEEQYGLARAAMEVYDRAVRTVPSAQRLAVYNLYLARASEFFGIAKVREVYETAIEAQGDSQLSDVDCKILCMRYAALERNVGEIDRARAIYVHASSLANPQTDKDFWKAWNDFEVKHGNEDTFREHRRILRSVAASFSTLHYNAAIIDAANIASSGTVEAGSEEVGKRKRDEMAELEAGLDAAAAQPVSRLPGFVSAGVIQQGGQAQTAGPGAVPVSVENPEDINIDEAEVGDADGGEEIQLEQQPVPEAVFSSAGALDRFAKKRRLAPQQAPDTEA